MKEKLAEANQVFKILNTWSETRHHNFYIIPTFLVIFVEWTLEYNSTELKLSCYTCQIDDNTRNRFDIIMLFYINPNFFPVSIVLHQNISLKI